MASFTVPCPKTSAVFGALQPNPNPNQNQNHRPTSVLVPSDSKSNKALLAGSSHDKSTFLGFQTSGRNQFDVFRVCAQLNEVSMEKSSNSVPVPEAKSEEITEKSGQKNIPDASSVSTFLNEVADLVKFVDSRDIMELQLKQLDCEVLIRKKEALPQPPVAAPYAMMQFPSPQTMVPSQLPPAPVAGPVPAPPISAPAPTSPAKPKSSHPPFKCPMAGTFYRCSSPGSPPFVKVGDKVQKGQVVCIIEAMKLMNDIEADQSGTVIEILVDDAKPVSVDTPLFIIEP